MYQNRDMRPAPHIGQKHEVTLVISDRGSSRIPADATNSYAIWPIASPNWFGVFVGLLCARLRVLNDSHLTETTAAQLRVVMIRIMSGWSVAAITSEVLASRRSRFPKEPVGALDAIHLGTLLVTRTSVPDL